MWLSGIYLVFHIIGFFFTGWSWLTVYIPWYLADSIRHTLASLDEFSPTLTVFGLLTVNTLILYWLGAGFQNMFKGYLDGEEGKSFSIKRLSIPVFILAILALFVYWITHTTF